MTYYFVKTTSKAKDNNKNFKGVTETYYEGKGGIQIFNLQYDKTEGWKRRHFAERYIEQCKEWDANEKYWTMTYEIIEVE